MIRDGYWHGTVPFSEKAYYQQYYGKDVTCLKEAKEKYKDIPHFTESFWRDTARRVAMALEKQQQVWNKWISQINNEDYYFFILTKEQYESSRGKEMMDELGLSKYVVYESPYAVNKNHEEAGPRLKVIIFHFPEGKIE